MLKFIYREHRGGLAESMKTIKKFNSLFDMIKYISIKEKIDSSSINFSLYYDKKDIRINWERTYIVCKNKDAIGFFTEVSNEN